MYGRSILTAVIATVRFLYFVGDQGEPCPRGSGKVEAVRLSDSHDVRPTSGIVPAVRKSSEVGLMAVDASDAIA